MELVVGKNTYISLEEANNIIASRFISKDPIKKLWDSLSEKDKEVLIISATEKYDNESMLYMGYKQNENQKLQYPRRTYNNKIIECPIKIKVGLLLQGLKDLSLNDLEESKLKDLGIKSFSDGSGASVTFENSNAGEIKNRCGIYKEIWNSYFKEYSLYV